MNIFPHFLYGPGEDALGLTLEYGGRIDENSTHEILETEKRKTLCNSNGKYMIQILIKPSIVPQC